ncbi:hypothetical protein F5Y00DRAFT_268057 [Daldinia vernicosa]|uniref:uncharacterized protein n=1 Tax=Daldinia vernicosa TaxID=114800 RepID=UPI002008798C|nr:uncharacterized protein F5Y00DRAFT_268057 [Daldinia vernicosa]KAI0851002.1 hypothetical protein F5Y00DRAFT_268057 [Daldinia vernicosa]
MAGELRQPTVLAIVFMLLTGLYGFVKFSHEKDYATEGKAAAILKEPVHLTSTSGLHPLVEHPIVDSTRPLVTYAYTESPTTRENLLFFVEYGLHDSADFIFILNGPTNAANLIPRSANIQVISRPNECFDLGAHGEVLRKNGLWKKYSRFILLNSGIRGPFVPYWSRSCWSDAFLNRVANDVKLVGTTATCHPKFHIHPTIWATDSVGMALLLNPPKPPSADPYNTGRGSSSSSQVVALGGCYASQAQATRGGIEATSVVKKAGYKVDALMAAFHHGRTGSYEDDCSEDWVKESMLYKHSHGKTAHPYETLFIKADSDVDPGALATHTEWYKPHGGNGSWDMCG